ncbi:hypothetical protein OG216_36560 [Streptomycetaceae bacterium NBC_01309]
MSVPASLAAAYLLYAGLVYSNAYYSYFRVDLLAFGFNPSEFVIRSLRLVDWPVVSTLVLVTVAAHSGELLRRVPLPATTRRTWARLTDSMKYWHPLVPLAGLVGLLYWDKFRPNQWIVPAVLGVGLLLGEFTSRRAESPPPPITAGRRARLLVVALCLLWAVAESAHQTGINDARTTEAALDSRPEVHVLSVEPMHFSAGQGIVVEGPFGDDAHFKYRYTGLRLVIQRSGSYYVVPALWRHDTGITYEIRPSDSVQVTIRSALAPGRALGHPQ